MKRQANESYIDYRARRTAENDRVDTYLKGHYVWVSKLPTGPNGEPPTHATMRKPNRE